MSLYKYNTMTLIQLKEISFFSVEEKLVNSSNFNPFLQHLQILKGKKYQMIS